MMEISKETKALLDKLQSIVWSGKADAQAVSTLKEYRTMREIELSLPGALRDADPAIERDVCNALKQGVKLGNAALRENHLRTELATAERNLTDLLQRFYQVSP